MITFRERKAAINAIDKAAKICAKYGLTLGNGGDISSMLTVISSELLSGKFQENEFLAEAQ